MTTASANPDTVGLRPIGRVVHDCPDEQVGRRRRELVAEVVLDPALAPALDGIEGYSHVVVIFWMHRLGGGPRPLKVHPRGRLDLPEVGVLATRGPDHPNPLGLAVVELLEREGARLRVRGLDAWSGTPVLDIKPCDDIDRPEQLRVPDWWRALRARPAG